MTSLYGIGLDLSIEKIHNDIKILIMKKGGGRENLHKIFEMIDLNHNGKLDIGEFEKGLNKFGFFPKKVEVQALLKFYDSNHDNMIDFTEFCKALREPLNERKFMLVSKVYDSINPPPSSAIPLKELVLKLNVTKSEAFLSGKRTKEQILIEFEAHFLDSNRLVVSKADFIEYYEEINLCIPSDQAFVELIERSWGLAENQKTEKDKEIILEKLDSLKKALLGKIKGMPNYDNIMKLFHSFDIVASFSLTFDEFANTLKRLHICMDEKYMGVLFKKIDGNNSGFIEFQEFYEFLL